jgi:NAD(P)-dependent dehydrogenase (short-subunit alcohol dehydrogenase family)
MERTFAGFIAASFPGQSLDLPINNAGVMAVLRRELNVDGYNYKRQFATNYLGPFPLTALVYPHLKAASGHAHRYRIRRSQAGWRMDYECGHNHRAHHDTRQLDARTPSGIAGERPAERGATPSKKWEIQFSDGVTALSITTISTGPLIGSSFNPIC